MTHPHTEGALSFYDSFHTLLLSRITLAAIPRDIFQMRLPQNSGLQFFESLQPQGPNLQPQNQNLQPQNQNLQPQRLELATLELELATLEPELATLELELATLEPELATLEPELATLETRACNLTEQKSTISFCFLVNGTLLQCHGLRLSYFLLSKRG